MTTETTMARKRLLDFALAAFKECPNPEVEAYGNRLVDAVEEAARQASEADRDRLAAELAEAKRDADLGWKAAQDQQDQIEEWADTCKRLMEHNEQLTARLHLRRGECGAVVTTGTEFLGRCTIGPHHPSFPHKDSGGARWQILVLPADTEPDDLTARLAAAYELRFDNDGHPEDTTAAVEVAMSVFGPELERLAGEMKRERDLKEGQRILWAADIERAKRAEAAVTRVHAVCTRLAPEQPDPLETAVAYSEGWNAALDTVQAALAAPAQRAALDGTGEA